MVLTEKEKREKSWSQHGDTDPTPIDIKAGLTWEGELAPHVAKLSTMAKVQAMPFAKQRSSPSVSTSWIFCSFPILFRISTIPQQSVDMAFEEGKNKSWCNNCKLNMPGQALLYF